MFSIGDLFYLLLRNIQYKKNVKERLLTLYTITIQKGVLGHNAGSSPKAHILFSFEEIVHLIIQQNFLWGLIRNDHLVTNISVCVCAPGTCSRGPPLRSSQSTYIHVQRNEYTLKKHLASVYK